MEMDRNILGVGPEKPTSLALGKYVLMDVSVAFGGGQTAVTVEPANVDAPCGVAEAVTAP